MESKFRVKFPCGYEYESVVRISFVTIADIHQSDKELPICPLHGKDCKAIKETKKK